MAAPFGNIAGAERSVQLAAEVVDGDFDAALKESEDVISTLSPLADAIDGYIAAGFRSVLALQPRSKIPGSFVGKWGGAAGWTAFADTPASPIVIANWKRAPHANIGVALGALIRNYYRLLAIDVDVRDEARLAVIRAALPYSPMVKTASKGFTAFYLGDGIESVSLNIGSERIIDVLGVGRQAAMPPSIHPEGMPYRWIGEGIVPVDTLPIFGAAEMEKLKAALRSLGWSDAPDVARRSSTGAQAPSEAVVERDAAGNYFDEIKAAALANLSAWVPDLGLGDTLRRKPGGYVAVAHWRDSSSGRPYAERSRNLSIHESGITDFGDGDKGYSAIDLVVAALGSTESDAAEWLAERLGLTVDDSMFDDDAIIANGLARAAIRAEGRLMPSRQLIEHSDGSLIDADTGEIVGATNDNLPCHDALAEVPEHLLHPAGLLGEVTDFIVETARSPSRTLALAAALVLIGTLAGRRDGGPTFSGTCAYVLGIAPTGTGKQHPQDMIQSLARAVGADHLVGTSDFKSGTAVVTLLSRKPLAMCCMDEFGSYLSRVNNKKASPSENDVAAMLRKMWTLAFEGYMAPEFAKTPSRLIHSPSLAILGMSTPQQFYNSLTGADVENGLLNRFLLLPTSRIPDPVKPTRSKFDVPEDLVGKLWDLFAARGRDISPPPPPQRGGRDDAGDDDDAPGAQTVIPEEVPWGEGAEAIFDAFHAESIDIVRQKPEFGEFVVRRAEMAVRLATIAAVSRTLDNPEVSIDDMIWGRDLARFSSERLMCDVQAYVGDTETSARWGKVEAILRKNGGKVAYSDLTRALKFSPRDMKDTLETMKAGEKIDIYSVERKGGTPGRKKQMILLLK